MPKLLVCLLLLAGTALPAAFAQTGHMSPRLVKDIQAGPASSGIAKMTALGDRVFFSAENGYGYLIWKSDGTSSGTTIVQPNHQGDNDGGYQNLTAIQGKLYYFDTTSGSNYLWQTDGTATGTVKVAAPGRSGFYIYDVTKPVEFQGTAWFISRGSTQRFEFWKTDGTVAGTKIAFIAQHGEPTEPVAAGGRLYYTAGYMDRFLWGTGLWMTDGTSTPTLVNTISPNPPASGYFGANPNRLTDANGTLFFVTDDGTHGNELWKSQGTTASTVLVRDINPGTTGTAINNLTNVNGKLFFTASEPGSGNELWVSDGTAGGTRLVKDIVPGAAGPYPANLINVNGALFFTADSPGAGRELWRSDGTPEGTMLVLDINPGPEGSEPDSFANAGGYLYFSAYEPAHGVEIWKSDGTAAGTTRISDISPGPASSNPAQLALAGRYLFFSAIDGSANQGNELWAIDVGPVTGVKDWRLYGE